MKLRNKLSLSFSIAGITTLLLFGLTIHFFSAKHGKEEFYNQLSKRVTVTKKLFLERDNFSADDLGKIKDQFLHNLPKERDEVLNVINNKIQSQQFEYPPEFLQTLLTENEGYFEKGKRQFAGKYFHLQGGDYVVIVSAIDVAGIEKLTYLKGIIIIGLIISIILFTLVSIPLSRNILRPISYKIKMANMISANNLHQRLTGITSKDEIGDLATAFNNLLDRIENAFEAKKAFISNASHEIRNPLTAIINETDISLEKNRTDEEYRESLKSISTEAERMKLLVDNLLELSKITNAETPFQFKYLLLIPFLHEIIAKYDFFNSQNKLNLIISEDVSKRNPGVWGNKNLLTSALINIIDNACKFSSDQDVIIELSLESGNAVIVVRDKGIGIPEGDLVKITEPFFRSANARNTKGSGIGLALTHRIVEIHRGKLSFSSIADKGTEVKITLPVEEQLKA